MKKRKECFLLTSPENVPQKDGNGSYNTDSPTPTGNRIPAILQKRTDLSSPLVTLSDFHKGGLSLWETVNGSSTGMGIGMSKPLVSHYLTKLFSLKI